MSTRNSKDMFTIKVGPAIYTVRKAHVPDSNQNGQFGSCDNIAKEIDIRVGMQPEQELQTLMHELLHAVINEYALRQAVGMEPDEEEVIVDLMALGLTQAFSASPQLLKYIGTQLKQAKS